MNPLAQVLSTASLLTMAIALVLAVLEFRKLRTTVETSLLRPPLLPKPSVFLRQVAPPDDPGGGYAIYVFRNDRWHLESDFTRRGYETTPPAIPGQFEGQVVKKESTARKLDV